MNNLNPISKTFSCEFFPEDKMEVLVYPQDGAIIIEGDSAGVALNRKAVADLIDHLKAGLASMKAPVPTEPVDRYSLSAQCQTILTHLETYGSISGVEAGDAYGVRALPRRIADLQEAGYRITREFRKHRVTGQRYVRYFLAD